MVIPQNPERPKVFVVGLPRTGTTSICAALLEHGLKVAHTGFSKQTFLEADVVADTPVWCDYAFLDQTFPDSRFIYTHREMQSWLPSIKILLQKLEPEMQVHDGGLNPVLRRCYREVFRMDGEKFNLSSQHLQKCYQQHQQKVLSRFAERDVLLKLDLSQDDSLASLCKFLQLEQKLDAFPHLNRDGKITAWKKVKHPLKVNSALHGPDRRKYFDV